LWFFLQERNQLFLVEFRESLQTLSIFFAVNFLQDLATDFRQKLFSKRARLSIEQRHYRYGSPVFSNSSMISSTNAA